MHASVRQLSALDAAFVFAETPECPMHVGTLAFIEVPEGGAAEFYAGVCALFAERLPLAPSLLLKLVPAPLEVDRPSWTTDDAFGLENHIVNEQGIDPQDQAAVRRRVGELHAVLLDRSRPLWNVTVFTQAGSRAAAIYTKMHHSLVDGGAGVAIARILYDTDLAAPPLATVGSVPATRATPPRPAQPATVIEAALGELWRAPFRPAEELKSFTLPRTGGQDMNSVLIDAAVSAAEWNVRMAASVPDVVAAIVDSARLAQRPDVVASFRAQGAPATPLNVSITAERSFGTVSLPLDRIKALATRAGGKVNDVVLALSAGMLRAYLTEIDALPATELTAFVPISTRESGDGRLKNQTYGMMVPLSTDVADPWARLGRIIERARIAKDLAGPFKGLIPHFMDAPSFGTPMIFQLVSAYAGQARLAETTAPQTNLVVSNVMLSSRPLFVAGARIAHVYPLNIVTHGQALGVTVQGYGEWLDVGLIAARSAVPDVDHLAALFASAFAELEAA